MAEESGFLSSIISNHTTQDVPSGSLSLGELFGDSCVKLSSDVWPSTVDINPEKQERSKFLLSKDAASTRTQPVQAMPETSYSMPSSQGGDGSFDYQKEMQNLEKLSAQLDTVKQQLMADILRCQLLQVDLATQFDPKLVQKLRSTKLSCEKCQDNFEDSVSD